MNRYATSQRKNLLEFLEKNPHASFSVKQIKDNIGAVGISTSAVYRNLALLEKDGLLQKIYVSNKKEVTYQYIGSGQCADHIHLVCEKCKKSSHFEKNFSDTIVKNAFELSGFTVNTQKTFICGLCSSCTTHCKDK